jgi:hypothetical protein
MSSAKQKLLGLPDSGSCRYRHHFSDFVVVCLREQRHEGKRGTPAHHFACRFNGLHEHL